MSDPAFKDKVIQLNGKLMTRPDPCLIGENFRQLINMRYTDTGVKAIRGQTYMTTSAFSDKYIRSIFNLRKEQPAESHILVQTVDTNKANPAVYGNTPTTIGSVSNAVSLLYTEDTSASVGRFAVAPDGACVYCNGKETCVYGGTEFRVASVILYDPDDNTKRWDYTEQVSNTDTSQVATLVKSGGALDSNTVSLLHFNGNRTDTVGTHTWDDGGSIAYTNNNQGVFDAAARFDGTTDYLYCDDANLSDFDLSAGIFTIDFWAKFDPNDGCSIYYQEGADNNNYTRIWIDKSYYRYAIKFDICKTAGFQLQLASDFLSFGTWYHVAVVGDGTSCYLFINGALADSGTPTTFPADLGDGASHAVYLGYDYNTFQKFFDGDLDEFRVVKGTAIWTSNFTTPPSAHPPNAAELYLGSILPISGVNFDVETANTAACVPVIHYWSGTEWASVGTVTDGTNNGTGALERDGLMSFTSTATLAKPRMIDSMYLYWYRLSLPGIDDTTTVSSITVRIPFQLFKDIWDGELRSVLSFLQWDEENQTYYDHTVAVFEDYYDSADGGTYAPVVDTGTSVTLTVDDDYLLVGSTERLSGLTFNLVSGYENATDATMSISYWDGDEWQTLSNIVDGTLEDNATLAKSGFVTWTPPDYGTEFRRQDLTVRRSAPGTKSSTVTVREDEPESARTVTEYYDYSGNKISYKKWKKLKESVKKTPFANAQYDYSLYWYKVSFNASLAANIRIYYLASIPAPVEIGGYKFPVFHDNAVWFFNEPAQHKNQAIKLAPGTVNVANGAGTAIYNIGNEEEVTAGGSLTMVTTEKILPVLVVFKKNQTWCIYGSGELSSPVLIDGQVGCVAPGTVKNATLTLEGRNVDVLIFQGHNGIYATDGRSVFELSRDIADVFDQDATAHILLTRMDDCEAGYDEGRKEYHWLWTSSGSLHNKEYVFDCVHLKWFEIQRGSGSQLQCLGQIRTTTGTPFLYGAVDNTTDTDGHLVRTENGYRFQGTSSTAEISYTFELGDIVLAGVPYLTQLRNIGLHSVGISTANTISVTHYGDTSTTASTPAITAFDAGDSGERVQMIARQVNFGPHIYHGLKFEFTHNADHTGFFEPLYLTLLYDVVRQNIRG